MYKILKFNGLAILILIASIVFTGCGVSNSVAPIPKAQKYNYDGVRLLVLYGSTLDMGIQYGSLLKSELKQILTILENYYIVQKNLPYSALEQQGNSLYIRFPANYQQFIQGIAIGSGLSLSDVKILNAMETLEGLLSSSNPLIGQCAFLFVPQNQTVTGASLIGRNYDYYPDPFKILSQYLTIAILNEPNTIPTAFISIAGEAYCPSCINANGIFMELNNGAPSGGYAVNTAAESMLSRMLVTLQNSTNLTQIVNSLDNVQSDFSLIVNVGDRSIPLSFEYSSSPSLGMVYYYPVPNQSFVVTNYFLDPVWGNNIPIPTDATTYLGVTRRNNLLNLVNQSDTFNLSSFKSLMDKNISQGGAVWQYTIYQLIFDQSDYFLYIKILSKSNQWIQIPIGQLLNNN